MINIGLKEELGITQFNHVSMVVKDLDQVLPILLIHGWKLTRRFTHKEAGRSLMSLDHPDYATKLEVMAPVGDDSYLWKFLAAQGNGSQHHITFYVKDLAKARKVLESRGFELHRDRPHEILIHPKRGGGTMVQFFQHRTRAWMMLWRARRRLQQHRAKLLVGLGIWVILVFGLWRRGGSH